MVTYCLEYEPRKGLRTKFYMYSRHIAQRDVNHYRSLGLFAKAYPVKDCGNPYSRENREQRRSHQDIKTNTGKREKGWQR